MKKRVAFGLLIAFLTIQSCQKNEKKHNSNVALYKDLITQFTAGFVSKETDIRVQFSFSKPEWEINQELESSLFEISPNISGKVVALSDNTIAFVPNESLTPNTAYKVTLHLEKITSVAKGLETFKFTFKTIKPDFSITTQDVQSYDKDYQYLNILMNTADNMDFEIATKIISATQNGKNLPLKFDKSMSSKTEFKFVIDSIQRLAEDSEIKISFDGNPFDVERKGIINYPIIGKNNFKAVTVVPGDENNQSIFINFSDPLKKEQDFNGLIAVQNTKNLKFSTQGNILKVFFDEPLSEDILVEVFQGIQSEDEFKTKINFASTVFFEPIKPGVRFVKSGTILPSSNNLKINFEAASLQAVDVKVFKMYKNNILQFLQDNELNGSDGLRKVAQPIAKKKINLKRNDIINYKKWNVYALDISKIINPEPGTIYRVEFSFKREYSIYKCSEPNLDSENEVEDTSENDVNYSNYDYYDDYYYENYNWQERGNPCDNYYYYNTKVGTNILASDIGVIVKRGENKSYDLAVSNIVTTEPISGALVELYSFQKQKLASFRTNSEGLANVQIDKFAYFAIVSMGKNSTYIKLDDGNSLSVSNFDVSGEALQKGLKGYIYGERGVWRPGDSLHLSFIFNDNANKLPNAHPIKFKLSDPYGKVTYQTLQKSNDWNHYKFTIPTQQEAPTGNWEALVSVGGARFYKSIKIETIKPNRLKIKNSFADQVLTSKKAYTNVLQVNWLHGAVAKELKTEVQAKFSQQTTTFKNYQNYIFDDPSRSFSTEEISIFSGKLDATGKANIVINPQIQGQAPGMLKAAFITKVYENGGDVSTDVAATTFSTYSTYIGLKMPEPNKYGMLETEKNNLFEIVTVDEKGNPKPAKNLLVKVYRMESRWWWDASNDDYSSYNSSNATTAYQTYNVSTNSSGKVSFQMNVPNDDWGRYFIRVSDGYDGHATGKSIFLDYPYGYSNSKNGNGDAATMLVFSSDKTKYNVGEKAKVFFPSSEGGRALISIENGTKVLQTFWVKTQKGETNVELPITAEMAPNVFINISLIQPHATTKNDSPIRMYGIIPIEVVDKNTVLEPKITMPNIVRPEQEFNIKVSEQKGKAMTYTIAIVDDGLLDLTRFKTPNAWNSFYAREALGVKTWDIYDDIIGAYGGKVNQVFSIGGDEDLGGGKAKKANRFKPVVVYLGPFKLEKGQTKNHKVKLPKYVGSVRTMIIAANAEENAYGANEVTTPVRSPLMVLASLPRKISPSEKVTLPVTIFAMENQIKNVQIAIKTNNAIRVLGNTTQNLSFSEPDEKMVNFTLEVGNITGIGKIEIIATSGKEKATYEVEIDVTNPNPITHTFKDVILESNQSQTFSWETFGEKGSNAAKLEISSMPTIDFGRRLDYLIQYPHGCIEQTTSSVFPQLYLTDVMDIPTSRKSSIQKNITAGIRRLGNFQLTNGGLSYWQGNETADDWGTSYAGHFMIEAEEKGYVLPINFKKKWISYQQREAKQWRFVANYNNDFAQAYRLYTLALVGSPDLASMNRLRETKGISNESKLRLAAAYAKIGQKQAGLSLLNSSKITEEKQGYYYYYGSEDRNRAMALETLLLLDQKQKAFETALKLAKNLSSTEWMSTQTTAYGLYAMSKFAQKNGGKGIDVTYAFSGKNNAIKTNKVISMQDLVVSNGKNSITIKNSKDNTLFVRVINSGILPVGKEQVVQNKLQSKVIFKDRKGVVLDVSKITQGTEFLAYVTLKNTTNERIENVALSQILPSGFEIVNTRFTDYGEATQNTVDFIDIRDDRANYYFSLKGNESKTFTMLLNASYLGTYYLPGIQAEAMYDNTYLVRSKGQWIEIVK